MARVRATVRASHSLRVGSDQLSYGAAPMQAASRPFGGRFRICGNVWGNTTRLAYAKTPEPKRIPGGSGMMFVMNASREVVHLLVRYRDPRPGIGTILEHQNVLAANGAVWFGKLGKRVGEETVRRLQDQIEGGVSTFLYLATRLPSGELRIHRARIAELTTDRVPADHEALIPLYYRELTAESNVCLWARVTSLEQVEEGGLDRFVVAASRRRVQESLRSSAPFLVMEEDMSNP